MPAPGGGGAADAAGGGAPNCAPGGGGGVLQHRIVSVRISRNATECLGIIAFHLQHSRTSSSWGRGSSLSLQGHVPHCSVELAGRRGRLVHLLGRRRLMHLLRGRWLLLHPRRRGKPTRGRRRSTRRRRELSTGRRVALTRRRRETTHGQVNWVKMPSGDQAAWTEQERSMTATHTIECNFIHSSIQFITHRYGHNAYRENDE